MYCLNGDRIYIKPADGSTSLDNQLQDCLLQLKNINSGKRIFKLNFFADTVSDEGYLQLKTRLQQLVGSSFETPVICGLIAQPPLTCRILVEAFYFDAALWEQVYIPGDDSSAMLFKRESTEVLIGHVQAFEKSGCRENAAKAFAAFDQLLKKSGIPLRAVIRQWNYIEDILGIEEDKQRYQEFNNVRTAFYSNHFQQNGYPAATGIGTNRGGIIVEFMAVNSREGISLSLDNPRQTAAHDYSEQVLVGRSCSPKSTPKFERARYLELFGQKQVFISGTASILGEKTIGKGNPAIQTGTTIENMLQLYSGEALSAITGISLQPAYGHARVYIKNRKDFPVIKKVFKQYYGNLPVVYLLADICREDLLVEIEGKVVLK
jgi:enamine deaminase RidA (YjgF/YER057c/UK114 family)